MEEVPVSEFALKIEGLSKSFGSTRALDDVTIEVPRESVYGLLGPNGAGKTTLFSVVANFLQADAGSVEVLGIDVRESSRLTGRLGILPQDALFQRNVPIQEQFTFFCRLAGRTPEEAREDVARALTRVGLGDYVGKSIHQLSHGMLKRLGIAQAFLGEPEVIILDEPTAGLDPQNARQIRDLIRELRSRGSTILVSSHNLAEIQELCDRVAILDRGRLVAEGAVGEITSSDQRIEFKLNRELQQHEGDAITEILGVDRIEVLDRTRYSISLNLLARAGLEAGEPVGSGVLEDASDAILSEVYASLLANRITPREVREGNTLEAHFFKVTGQGESGA